MAVPSGGWTGGSFRSFLKNRMVELYTIVLCALIMTCIVKSFAGRERQPNAYFGAGECTQEALATRGITLADNELLMIQYRWLDTNGEYQIGWTAPGTCRWVPRDRQEGLQARCTLIRMDAPEEPTRIPPSAWVDHVRANRINECGVRAPCPYDPGHGDYCQECGPCLDGEGDCDPGQCDTGHVCMTDIGASYGWPATVDVCQLDDPAQANGE